VCPSGLAAIATADQMIRAGEIELAVAGGMESMTNAPYVIPKARDGQRLGNSPMLDTMIHDGLWCAFDDRHMGEGTDAMNREYGVDRAEQDAWAARSHTRAAAAWDEGRFDDEVVAVSVPQRKGAPVVVARDEGIRPDTTAERLASLRPAFTEDGTVTAGNASQISDGACAVIVASEDAVRRLGLTPLARIEAYGMSADRFASLHTVPALALEKALKRIGATGDDLDVVEINEAFAGVAVHATRMLGIDEAIVNPNGGAVAVGHPIGASGARIVLTAVLEMRRRDAELAAAAICGGGGQGDALILRRA
jgi:acetyl-CoA C-acetyltransferase